MKYRTITGKEIDTDRDIVICPICNKVISKEDIQNDKYFTNGGGIEGEYGTELMHEECAERAEEWERDNGYRV